MANEQRESAGSLGLVVSTVVAAHAKLAGEVLAPFEIAPVQWSILQECAPALGTTATQLARVVPIDSTSISRNVERLVRLGLLQRQRLARDRRVVRLTLTDDGHAILPEIMKRMKVVDATLLAGVTAHEYDCFLRTVRKVAANVARSAEQADPDHPG